MNPINEAYQKTIKPITEAMVFDSEDDMIVSAVSGEVWKELKKVTQSQKKIIGNINKALKKAGYSQDEIEEIHEDMVASFKDDPSYLIKAIYPVK